MKNLIYQAITGSKAFKDFIKLVKTTLPINAGGISGVAKSHVAGCLCVHENKKVVFVTATEESALRLSEDNGVYFPPNQIFLRNVNAISREEQINRIKVLTGKDKLIYMSVEAFIQRMMPPEVLFANCINLKMGKETDVDALLSNLVKMGYERGGSVYSKGEFAKRGEIIDIFVSNLNMPIRITLFDTQIESIKLFDAETQKSLQKELEEITIPPVIEVILDKPKLIDHIKNQNCEDNLKEQYLYEISEDSVLDNANTFLGAMYEYSDITHYFKDAYYIFDDFERISKEAKRIWEEYTREHARLVKTGEAMEIQAGALIDFTKCADSIVHKTIDFSVFDKNAKANSIDFNIHSATGFLGRTDMLANAIKERRKRGYKVLLFAGKKATALSRELEKQDIVAPITKDFSADIIVSEEELKYGFEIQNTILLGQTDIFGRAKKHSKKSTSQKTQEDFFSDLSPGDYIVHEIHGKGRYLGLKTMEAGGVIAEYMEIEYKGSDKLYISTSQIDRVQKYIGSEDSVPALSKLGGKEWENAKAKVREGALKLAFNLVELYSSRFNSSGFAFSEDNLWQRQFEDAFLYEETEGQEKSIAEIKKDMQSNKVMDRLLLGDVGYGKTEVAMRAAMKAATDSKQVAVLVPTTLLARQHLKTFKRRFEDFPVTVEGISRFSKSKHKEILANLKRGKTDIIIGTHRLLSKDVEFNDLGLLIVDEEQRFGVSHKEKIKLLKESVDVLTLSATPIPRTLEMSMVGVRDMSTIDTPPPMRKQPHSYVVRYSGGLLRDAVLREIQRDGQVYFVCRQIAKMDGLLAELKEHVPEARVAAAHGQMSESEIERIVGGFIDKEYDVLICTTIIESGIDIPTVNTIVVYEADKFGLSQLYQLKGRVGRSDVTAYAYFTYLGDGIMKENATKRLEAIREFAQLGSGFKIAMRDLQIRGAGNLLGPEQSGHMATVGYFMYCKIMKEAVALAKGGKVPIDIDCSVELHIPAYIPDSYIDNQTDKMDIYKLIARIKTLDDAKGCIKDVEDRFGKLPKEVNNIIVCALIKSYGAKAGVASIIKKQKDIELKYSEKIQPNMKKLLKIGADYKKDVIIRGTDTVVVVYTIRKTGWTNDFLTFLSKLARKQQ